MNIKDILGVEVKDRKIWCKYCEITSNTYICIRGVETSYSRSTTNIERLYEISKVVSQVNEPTWKLISLMYKEHEKFLFRSESFQCGKRYTHWSNKSYDFAFGLENYTTLVGIYYLGKELDLKIFNTEERNLITKHIIEISDYQKQQRLNKVRQELDDFISEKLK